MTDVVLAIDCGSTNISVAAVDEFGRIVAESKSPNGPVRQTPDRDWLVWDVDAVWTKVAGCCRDVAGQVGNELVRAVSVMTMGADGAPVTGDGRLTHPPICWQCRRTEPVAERLADSIGRRRLYEITGYHVIRFNTLFPLAWLRENAPEALDEADRWLMMAGLLSHRLCGEMSLNITNASTMMMLDIERRAWSSELLDAVGVDESFFPELVYPGRVIGSVTNAAATATGLKAGTAVVAAGHDTQFAPIGSGAEPDEAVLSSGTWEIAMLRTERPANNDAGFRGGLLNEVDAVAGLYDPQLLMMGSAVLEWVRERFYADLGDSDAAYGRMIEEARELPAGAEGLTMVPSFEPDTGPQSRYGTAGTLVGLRLSHGPAHIYRAALEGLSFQLREALRTLTEATGMEPARVRVVGGGARNDIWNQMRADVTGLPVVVTETREACTLGGAACAWVGVGRYESPVEAAAAIRPATTVLEPSSASDVYGELFRRYRMLPPALEDFYKLR